MATVLFVEASGAEHRIDVPTGENLMRAALNEGLDGMVGECGGGLACATCHCYVISAADGALSAPKQDEADTVEFNAHEPQENSRLTCQVIVTEALEGAVFQVATGR